MSQGSQEKQKDIANQIEESIQDNFSPNPLKRKIKVKQFPWTRKQKDFFNKRLFSCKNNFIFSK